MLPVLLDSHGTRWFHFTIPALHGGNLFLRRDIIDSNTIVHVALSPFGFPQQFGSGGDRLREAIIIQL